MSGLQRSVTGTVTLNLRTANLLDIKAAGNFVRLTAGDRGSGKQLAADTWQLIPLRYAT